MDPYAEKAKTPPSYQLTRQLDQERIEVLKKRVDELLRTNTTLRSSASRNEKDTHDIVLYFQREMEMKDEIISKLNEELVKRETQLKFEAEKLRKTFETEMFNLRTTTDQIISDLSNRLSVAESELQAVDTFRKEKNAYEERVSLFDKTLEDHKQKMFTAMEDQERKFLEEKSQMLKDLDDQKAAFRDVALREARLAMGEEAKRVLADNARMFEELKFHHSMTSELQVEKAAMEATLKTLRRDVSILTEKEMEYAKMSFYKGREIKAMRERVEALEQQQAVNLERFKHKTKELRVTVNKELEEAVVDAAGLRRLLELKNKELRQMKALASTVLAQRSEVEQFFLEALQEVKEALIKERSRPQVDTKNLLNKLKSGSGTKVLQGQEMSFNPDPGGTARGSVSGGVFPPLKLKSSQLPYLEPKHSSAEGQNRGRGRGQGMREEGQGQGQGEGRTGEGLPVSIQNMSWADRELVLRVLFAKMNGVHREAGEREKERERGERNNNKGNPQDLKPVFISEGAGLGMSGVEGDGQGSPVDLQWFELENEQGEGEDDENGQEQEDYSPRNESPNSYQGGSSYLSQRMA